METKNTPPRGTDWEKDGIGIGEHGLVVIRLDDFACTTNSVGYIRECIMRRTEFADRLARAEEELKYREPAKFVPEMIAILEKKAEHADSAGNYAQSAAYSDAARMLRKALRQ